MALILISSASAPAIGDVRALGAGDYVYIRPDAKERRDWPRYADALSVAVTRGANVQHLEES